MQSHLDRCKLIDDIPRRDYTSDVPYTGGVGTGVSVRLVQVKVFEQLYNVGASHMDGYKLNDDIHKDIYTSCAPCRGIGTGVGVQA